MALLAVLDDAAKDDEIRVLVLTGAGRGFCAGGEVANMPGAEGGQSPEGYRQHLQKVQKIYIKLHNFEKPTIAMVQGYCIMASWMMACACDIIVASDDAKFQDKTSRSWGGAQLEYPAMYLELGARKAKE